MELWQTLQLGWSGGLLERGYGGLNTLEPLLLVEHIIGLQSVRLAWRGVLEANSKGRLKTLLEKVLDSQVLFLSVTKSFGCQLVTTVAFVGIQAWQLKSDKRKQSTSKVEYVFEMDVSGKVEDIVETLLQASWGLNA
ncbi:hypothetical protein MC885_000524 [Smutsia gigantea]|nr:hypothetical protein MC885_000524 [Smutsia gigantea]